MPKDYQEIEKIVEEVLEDINTNTYLNPMSLNLAKGYEKVSWINALTTYGNARELQGVEKVEDQYASDIKVLKESHEIMLDAISCMTLEAFMIWSEHRKTKVKSELK
jgi:hypothetical protein